MPFTRTIPSDKESAKKLIADAMTYLSEMKTEGFAVTVIDFDFRLALDEAMVPRYAAEYSGTRQPPEYVVAKTNEQHPARQPNEL